MVSASCLGYPRIGPKRQLKTALEKFWHGTISEDELLKTARNQRLSAWRLQQDLGIDFIPSNDFSLYDHVLDTAAMVGAIPSRFKWQGNELDLNTYFLMARGTFESVRDNGRNIQAPPMEMTKWFDTNYHFIVPEIESSMRFRFASRKCVNEYLEAKEAGIETRPVLLGPVTFLYLSKGLQDDLWSTRLQELTEIYFQMLVELRNAGAQWIQVDEPCLSLDLDKKFPHHFRTAYERMSEAGLSIMLASYFSSMGRNLPIALDLPVQGIHLDLIRGADDLAPALENLPATMSLSAGVIDGRNVWRANLKDSIQLLGDIAEKIGPDKLIVSPSSSLMFVPIDAELETAMDPQLRALLSFADQKLREISTLTDGLCCGLKDIDGVLAEERARIESMRKEDFRTDPIVEERLSSISERMLKRNQPFEKRYELQKKTFDLPLLPTTTIGSFPQTKEIRAARKKLRSREIDELKYAESMRTEIANNIALQEKMGIDVFVHGEPERTDMVEYFAERMQGMLATQHGWVQSYGSRCVKPPIIYGAVARNQPMTVEWAQYAQSLTDKPVKGMLTGPLTILKWSFPRADQPVEKTCMEIALAVRDEVLDLERGGIKIIQIDEPAMREGLPLKTSAREAYLKWSVECFRLATSGVADDTQIHTHMCYSEFDEIMQAIISMDADVISIEAARSGMDLLASLSKHNYPNAIGPGVYDIHSPLVPAKDDISALLKKALQVVPAERLWVNPDCGLKTRSWQEVVPALNAMVEAAANLRSVKAEIC